MSCTYGSFKVTRARWLLLTFIRLYVSARSLMGVDMAWQKTNYDISK